MFRYRLHVSTLPGKPDLVFKSRRKIIFVHGCFWHRHGGCANDRPPKSRLEFWKPKLDRNKRRDRLTTTKLRKMGWSVMVVWECELKNLDALKTRVS